jgi:asparagine synthase (glutamine-hydrolysing)
MGNSIESRLPFLDYRLVELGVALPPALKLRAGRGKWIVRNVMADELPEAIGNARFKRGFDIQQNRWVDEGLGDHIRTLLRDRWNRVSMYVTPGSTADGLFSNENLKQRPSAFVEANTLLWIADASNDDRG